VENSVYATNAGDFMIDQKQLRNLITRILEDADLLNYSDGREIELLMMTAATESNLGEYIRQKGGGPALGIFQMEPLTHDDHWDHYIKYHAYLPAIFKAFYVDPHHILLEYDLRYAIIMARIHYLRDREPIPPAKDVEGLARYYKRVWNTYLGKATVEDALDDYLFFCT
jgi:hypothetical protein